MKSAFGMNKNSFILFLFIGLISCYNQESKSLIKSEVQFLSFSYMGESTMELHFNQNLDGYQYELELTTKAGKHINNKGIFNNGQQWLDSTICYSLYESVLPQDIFNKSTRLKTLSWKVFNSENNELIKEGTENIEVKSLEEYLKAQSSESSSLPWRNELKFK